MRLVGLVSGGKDSIYNLLQCIAAGHEIVAVANIEPYEKKDELDSYMYQTAGHQAVSMLAGALALPIYRQRTKGIAVCKEKQYVVTPHDEVEDLFVLLRKVKDELHVEGVASGAIASDYQRTRVENVCARLGLKSFAYLWRRDQADLLQEMIDAEMHAIVIKVASLGLLPEVHLGMTIKELQPSVIELNRKFGVNICGEGGEYETFTLDCPLFHRMINILESEKVIHSDDAFAPIAYLIVKNACLETKVWGNVDPLQSLSSRINEIKSVVKKPYQYVEDCLDEALDEFLPQPKKPPQEEVIPFPFNNIMGVSDSGIITHEHWKPTSSGTLASHRGHSSHVVTFSPSSLLSIDTTVCHLNHTSGWCCVGNVTAPSVKEGIGFVRKHLERFQYELKDIVSVSLYVRESSEMGSINKVYAQCIPNVEPPVRACVMIPLPPDVAVVMVVIAHRIVSKTQKVLHHVAPLDRETVHVESISHWAPANIGPYSQCVRIGDIYYLAGQIPLIPGSMELLYKPILHQSQLTLRHVLRVLQCVNESLTLKNILQAVCYVTSESSVDAIPAIWSYVTGNDHATVTAVVVSSLPKNAQLEWHVLACGYEKPRFGSCDEVIGEEFLVRCTRCVFFEQMTGSVVCKVSYFKKSKLPRTASSDIVVGIMRHCLQYLRGDFPNTPLCNLKLFYKVSDSAVTSVINEAVKTAHDFKVVATPVPVLACCEPEVFLTIAAVCH